MLLREHLEPVLHVVCNLGAADAQVDDLDDEVREVVGVCVVAVGRGPPNEPVQLPLRVSGNPLLLVRLDERPRRGSQVDQADNSLGRCS